MSTTTATDRISINLSDRAPARVSKSSWPIIARADWHSGQHECQANEIARIRVRQHTDGRSIVYGLRDSGPGGVPIGYRGATAGYMLAKGDDIARAIRRVAGAIGMDELAQECIDALPTCVAIRSA